MAQPLDAMQIYQGYQTANALNALRAQQMQQSAAMHPLQMQEVQMNMLAKRAALEEDQRRRNALAQYGATGNINALAMGDPKLAAQIQMQREKMNMMSQRPARPLPWQTKETENGLLQINPLTGETRPVLNADGTPVTGKKLEKALPTSAAQKLMENQQNLRRAEQASALLEGRDIKDAAGNVVMQGDREATGNKGLLTNLGVIGDKTLNFLDPKGVDARAAVGDLGSLIIHDRSGAAVTASEFPRLRPFIPLSSDSPDVARRKVARFKTEYQNIQQEMADFYRESGYKVPSSVLRGSGASEPAAAAGGGGGIAAPRVGEVIDGWRFRGGNPADRSNWERGK